MASYCLRFVAFPIASALFATTVLTYDTLTIETVCHRTVIALLVILAAKQYDEIANRKHQSDTPEPSTV
jgi:hypothetical protein